MSIESYIPELWAAALLTHLDNTHVYANLVNRNYEGDIRNAGDTVRINMLGDVTIKDVPENGVLDEPEQLETTEIILTIDQKKYFNFAINDIDKAQAAGELMNQATSNAAYGLRTVSDKFLANLMSKEAGVKVGADAGVALTAANAYDYLIDLKTALDKQNVPDLGRWVVVPPEMEGLLLKDNRFVSANNAASENRLVNGLIGRAAGFDIHKSNDVPVAAGKYSILASYHQSTTYAEQILKNEAYRPERGFADALKGLHVYGAKVVRPKTIAKLTATF